MVTLNTAMQSDGSVILTRGNGDLAGCIKRDNVKARFAFYPPAVLREQPEQRRTLQAAQYDALAFWEESDARTAERAANRAARKAA